MTRWKERGRTNKWCRKAGAAKSELVMAHRIEGKAWIVICHLSLGFGYFSFSLA